MASPVTQRLGGEAFDGGEELDGDRFLRLIIPGRSAIRGKLISEQEIAELGYSPYVATTIRVDSGGEPLETYLDVGQETQGKRQKFSAHRIFAGCVSPDTKILLGKLDFSLFNFPPSSNHSDWLNATELGLAFQKKNNRSLGEYSSEEWSTQGVGDFSLKLVINATEEVGVASIRVMALPLPVERLGELPGGNAKDTRSYPAIDVFSNPFEFQMLPQNFEPLRNDGLPVLPFILYQGGPGTQPTSLDTGKLLRCMYAVWSNDAGARGVTAQVLAKLLESLPLDTSPVAAEWAWPRLEQEEDNSEILGSMENEPVERPGAAKYCGYRGGSRGWYSVRSFPNLSCLSEPYLRALISAANNAISTKTWTQYNAVRNHLLRAQVKLGLRFTFPMSEAHVLAFVSYLFGDRNLSGKYVSSLLSALRMLHLSMGHSSPELRPAIIKLVLKGKENWDEEQARGSIKRLPVTLTILKMIKLLLKMCGRFSVKEQVLIWSVCSIAFNGAFRVGELLSKTSRTFDPLNVLLRRDVWITNQRVQGKSMRILNVRLKSSKESQASTRGIVVEVFENETMFCPVKAYLEYVDLCGTGKPSSPAFRTPTGWAYRHGAFNDDLKTLLAPYITYGRISAHSFRSGMASLMAMGGLDDELIKAAGRWSSAAFKNYVLLTRVTRCKVAGRMAELMISGP